MTSLIPFQNLARYCANQGIENVIICPGSRNAALTIAFVNEKSLKCYSLSDERSAAFVAIGMALQTGTTTAIICTSGTAVLNFTPAIAESYFQEIPLLILTADRPPEWIHQYDGQTIFQKNVYGKHVKKSFQWSADQSKENLIEAENISKEAIMLCSKAPKGPVHINIPIREPFYPESIEEIKEPWKSDIGNESSIILELGIKKEFLGILKKNKKRLLVVGQQHSPLLGKLALQFADKFGFVLVADHIANVSGGIKNHDTFIWDEKLSPDFLISLDKSLISKSLKLMLRNSEIENQWHIQDNPAFIDPFLSLKKKVLISSEDFLRGMLLLNENEGTFSYQNEWKEKDSKSNENNKEFFKTNVFSEFFFLKELLLKLPESCIIHSGNSMSVRYLNALQSYLPKNIFHCNRGTSGIDGSLSTAVGQAMKTDKTVFCVLGDVSFQYDKNALWNTNLPANIKIVILNNAGGIIFGMIKGPKEQESYKEFFQTKQSNKADLLAKEYGLTYYSVRKNEDINTEIKRFLNCNQACILEVFTDAELNEQHFKQFLSA